MNSTDSKWASTNCLRIITRCLLSLVSTLRSIGLLRLRVNDRSRSRSECLRLAKLRSRCISAFSCFFLLVAQFRFLSDVACDNRVTLCSHAMQAPISTSSTLSSPNIPLPDRYPPLPLNQQPRPHPQLHPLPLLPSREQRKRSPLGARS